MSQNFTMLLSSEGGTLNFNLFQISQEKETT